MPKTNIARMTWPEVKEAVDRNAVVMIPIASIEPSGRHSVMGGEIFVADYFTEGVAVRTSSVWLPTIPFGYAPNFMGFPGTVNLQASTLVAVLEDVCHSMLHHGFDHIMIVDNHSGNEPIVEQVARKVRQETGVVLAKVLLPPIMQAASKDLYPNFEAVHGHGGEPGVSARLFLCPDDMRLDLAVKTETTLYQGLKVLGSSVPQPPGSWTLYLDYHETNPSGGTGDPFGADADRGKVIMERMVDYGAQVVEKFRTVPTRRS
jgi:creatinine amidohydrolase